MKKFFLKILSTFCIFIGAVIVVILVKVFALNEPFSATMFMSTETLGIAGFLVLAYILYLLLKEDKGGSSGGGGSTGKGKTEDGKTVSHYFNMRWISDDELIKEKKFGFNYYSDLKNCKKDGILIRSELKNNRLLVNLYKPIHTLVLGTTGSGKTEGFVIPSINVLSSCATKPSLIITDPKGELYKKTGRKLIESGYEIKMLDLREPQKSACWNPMADAFDLYHKAYNLLDEVRVFKGINPADTEYKHIESVYNNEWYGFNGIAYPNKSMLENDLLSLKAYYMAKADDILHEIAIALCPVLSEKDPVWEKGAQDFIWGVMTAMLEDSLDPELEMTKEKFNLYNVAKICSFVDVGDDPYLTLRNYVMVRDKSSSVVGRVATSINNAPSTAKSYMGIVLSAMSLYTDSGIAFATSKNEMDFDGFADKPIALIIRVPDNAPARHPLATLMISRVYSKLVEQAEKYPNTQLPRNVYFILDEFANLPKLNDFGNVITVARSRGIFFNLVVQSYSQLNSKYGDNIAKTIRDNCNIQIYIGSDDMATKEEFSKSCGYMSIEKTNVSKSTDKKGDGGGQNVSKENVQRPLIYPDELGVLPSEIGIVKIFHEFPMKVKFSHSYKYPMFTRVPLDEKYVPMRRLKEEEVTYDITQVVNKRRRPNIFD